MPSPRYIPAQQTQQENPLGNLLSSFLTKNNQTAAEDRETDALSQIYKQYQGDGDNIRKKIEAVQTAKNISPTTRVNTVKQLLDFERYNQDLQKNSIKQIETQNKAFQAEEKARVEKQEKEAERERARQALKDSGASQQQIALYEASPVGGQTKVVEDVIENTNRKKAPPGLQAEDVNDYDIGLTPKERVKRQDARFSLQTPLVTKNSDTISALESEKLSLDLLEELDESGKVGQGVHNLNINPKTGDLLLPKAATPEEQLFVKTVNDFTVKAKDSFGARVTNFELDRFMQRLPTLANSQEGRKLIIRQMKIINQLNAMEKKAIQGVFDQYGVRNIDYVDAENKARTQIKDQKEALRKEFLNLEQLAKKEDSQLVENVKQKVLSGYIAMRKPDGTIKQFPEKNVPNLEEKGYKRL